MATIQLGNTKIANKLLSYAEKRAEEREGVDCPPEYAKAQMKATRELWGKNDGIQAHHVIQSFKPGEVTPELANQIGQELAREIAKGHECVVYTHTDKDHIHNHIVINSVSYEDGRKFHAHGKEAIDRVREASDRLCEEHNLSVIKEPSAKQRYHRAEYGLASREIVSWKDEIRDAIDHEREHSTNYEEFKKNLAEKYGIEVKERGKNISFKHPDNQRFVRGKTLGLAYERGTLENVFSRENERKHGQERGNADLSSSAGQEIQRTGTTLEGNQRAELTHEKLHSGSHGQRWDKPNDHRSRTIENQENKRGYSKQDDFDIAEARRYAERLRQSTANSYGKWQEGNDHQQSPDVGENEQNRDNTKQRSKRNDRKNEREHERTREQSHELDR